jgi:hypothetical protein
MCCRFHLQDINGPFRAPTARVAKQLLSRHSSALVSFQVPKCNAANMACKRHLSSTNTRRHTSYLNDREENRNVCGSPRDSRSVTGKERALEHMLLKKTWKTSRPISAYRDRDRRTTYLCRRFKFPSVMRRTWHASVTCPLPTLADTPAI